MRFSVTSPPGRRGAQPPASLRGTMKSGSTGQMRSSNPPPGCGGGCARVRKPRPGALTARKDAVWAEGFAEGAPGVRPGHHQAASCGLRRCRELGLREFVWVAASLPWRMWWVSPPGDAGVYTDRRNWPLGSVLRHLCTLLRRELYDANYVGWYEHLNHHGVPAAPPCWSPLPWSGRQALREWRRR